MIVGLTGGIGSGKSTVADMFKNIGVPVYDSDSAAKSLMTSSDSLRKAIIDLLGTAAYADQKLNTTFIAHQVFKDKELLKALNAIVHPAVQRDFKEWEEKQDFPYVIQESALIYENKTQGRYDMIIVVSAPEAIRIQRVINRDKVEKSQVLRRMTNQLPQNAKIQLADFVIENDDLVLTGKEVAKIHQKLMAKAKSS